MQKSVFILVLLLFGSVFAVCVPWISAEDKDPALVGVKNTFHFSGIDAHDNKFTLEAPYGDQCFSIQQNFFVECGDGSYIWVQNVYEVRYIEVAPGPPKVWKVQVRQLWNIYIVKDGKTTPIFEGDEVFFDQSKNWVDIEICKVYEMNSYIGMDKDKKEEWIYMSGKQATKDGKDSKASEAPVTKADDVKAGKKAKIVNEENNKAVTNNGNGPAFKGSDTRPELVFVGYGDGSTVTFTRDTVGDTQSFVATEFKNGQPDWKQTSEVRVKEESKRQTNEKSKDLEWDKNGKFKQNPGKNEPGVSFWAPLEWPMFSLNPDHTSWSFSTAPNSNSTLWTVRTGAGIYSSPAVDRGIAYVGSLDHNIYAFNASTGILLWNHTTGSSIYSSPAVSDGRVFVGSIDRNVYAFNASDGSLIWSYTTNNIIYCSPTVAYGRVYIGSHDTRVYALNATTGQQVWNYSIGMVIYSCPAVAYDTLYIGSALGRFRALNATTGALIWNGDIPGEIFNSSPAFADGKVYVQSLYGNVYVYNATTGSLLGSYATGGGASSPCLAYGFLYVGSSDNKVYAFNTTNGALGWSYLTGGSVGSSPCAADGKVFFGSNDHKIYALNALTGALVWTYETGGEAISSPAVAEGKLYAGSYDFRIYCFADHDVAAEDVFPYKRAIARGYSVIVDMYVSNQGFYPETFNVTAKMGGTVVGTQTLFLAPRNSTIITFIFDSTGFAFGNYTLSALTSAVPYEVDISDNVFVDGSVHVGFPGDINCDGKVDFKDVYAVGRAFGSYPNSPKWNSNCDVNTDLKVDLKDYYLTCKNYGAIE